jgi:hypothetical protein
MSKQEWQKHWHAEGPHDTALCAQCQARRKTRERSRRRRERDDVMRSLGLTKVRGAISGRTYWE